MISEGVNIHHRDQMGTTAFLKAAENVSRIPLTVFQILVEAGANPLEINNFDCNCFHIFAKNEDTSNIANVLAVADYFYMLGIRLDAVNFSGFTPLMRSASTFNDCPEIA